MHNESTHICATRVFLFSIILLQLQKPIEPKCTQACHVMHNMLGYTNK